jgi:hypothetical protein
MAERKKENHVIIKPRTRGGRDRERSVGLNIPSVTWKRIRPEEMYFLKRTFRIEIGANDAFNKCILFSSKLGYSITFVAGRTISKSSETYELSRDAKCGL